MITRLETYDFWTHSGGGYAALSMLSNPDDWAHIIDAIAGEISSSLAAKSAFCRFLDVGTGLGETAFRLSQRLLATYRIRSRATLVEPSARARDCARLRWLPLSYQDGASIVDTVEAVPDAERFDAILYIHSTYYVSDLRAQIRYLRSRLARGGIFVFLALPKESPFFLGLGDLGHKNLADAVDELLVSEGFQTCVTPLVSRVTIPESLWDSPGWRALWMKMYPTTFDEAQLQERLPSYIRDGTNLADRLIVAKAAHDGT